MQFIVDLCTKSSYHINNKPYHGLLAAAKMQGLLSFVQCFGLTRPAPYLIYGLVKNGTNTRK